MIYEVQAKTLLSSAKEPDPCFGIRYTMNLYRGCQHQCIYCDSRSACYGIENFHDVQVKVNALDLLRAELPRKRQKGTIGTGSMSDPYIPAERHYNLTGRALEIIALYGYPVHIITKSDLVLRDIDTLKTINQTLAVVSFSLSTADDALARKLEPGAPPPSQRLQALRALAANGIHTGITMMPILPFITDSIESVRQIVQKAADAGASYILAWFGMTLRDQQRDYYYTQLDRQFPGIRQRYARRYGGKYSCNAPETDHLWAHFKNLCAKYGIAYRVPIYQPEIQAQQLQLL